MFKFKRIKSILLTTSLALGLSLFIPINTFAATYTTVNGDSLYKISQLFSTTTTKLMSDNHLQNTLLNVGQVLNVPANVYTVQKGDTLFLIAQKHKVTVDTLRRTNHIYTDIIHIGQILNIPVSTRVSTFNSTTYTASDLDLLSRLITAEAQGESYDAKVGVGAVVVNRVKSNSFPSSIGKVIYEKTNGYYQFSPVANGWINKPADSDSLKAAKAALNGIDPTKGALYYYDNTTTNKWILSKPIAIKIGNMVYAY